MVSIKHKVYFMPMGKSVSQVFCKTVGQNKIKNKKQNMGYDHWDNRDSTSGKYECLYEIYCQSIWW